MVFSSIFVLRSSDKNSTKIHTARHTYIYPGISHRKLTLYGIHAGTHLVWQYIFVLQIILSMILQTALMTILHWRSMHAMSENNKLYTTRMYRQPLATYIIAYKLVK